MVKLSDCSHMEIKKIYHCDIIMVGKKAVCCIDIADINEYDHPKRLHIAISNLYSLMDLFDVRRLSHLIGQEAKCLIHKRFKEVSFIAPLLFESDVETEEDFIYCSQIKILD